MPLGQSGFFRGRCLSAGTQDASDPSDAGKSPQGTKDDSGSKAPQDRSGSRPEWSVDQALGSAGIAGGNCSALLDPNVFRNRSIHIAAAQISRIAAKKPKHIRPISSLGTNPTPTKLPVNLRSPEPN